ncbi:TPA: hypothetical protein DIC38_02680 [Candidatus Nomurabacteria bacterium]|nr:MAG: hypothetical protein O210_OD1C00001G0043 [Parcubacteria bacterium RAAC4_OD1_1]HCY26558.1 hypothetical protein [Candidatus Nomurabacteria bacterium]
MSRIKNNSLYKVFISSFFVALFFLSYNQAFSADIRMVSTFHNYKVGDTIKINVNVNSKTSVNAVSGVINFPTDKVSLSSVSKDDSIISLWAKDPVFLNDNDGSISFEGIILNGFIGKEGQILTLNFKAKKEGTVNIYFNYASVLANDGNGSEVVEEKKSITINIKETFIVLGEKLSEAQIEEGSKDEILKIVEIPKEAILKIRKIEEINKIPVNNLVILFGLLVILILFLIIIYGIYYISKFKKYIRKRFFIFIFLFSLLSPLPSFANDIINLNAPSLLPRSELFISPRTGDFIVGSTFDAPIYINTLGNDVNAISVKIKFDPRKLSIIRPSGGKSIFGIWVEPPSYDNQKGTASLVGVIPDGIVSSSGLVATITFKVLSSGDTNVFISNDSSANMNDGLGTPVRLSLGNAYYNFTPKIPDGVLVFSDTHPMEGHWYNNNSPIIRWENSDTTEGFNVILDNNPNTIPSTSILTTNSSISYENLKDGVWYLHVREKNKEVWGNPSHFQIKIDTNKPALFKPEASILEEISGTRKYSLSFVTTDSLSNISHYEVGTIEKKNEIEIASPVFIETESPYIVPNTTEDSMRVIVRAFDFAGNMQEAYVDLYPGYTLFKSFKKYGAYLLGFLVIFMLFELLFHYLFGHHILSHVKKAYYYFKGMSDYPKEEEKPTEESVNNIDK